MCVWLRERERERERTVKPLCLGIHHLHVVGHSLGAHAAGFLGKKLIADGYTQLKRITGRGTVMICLFE